MKISQRPSRPRPKLPILKNPSRPSNLPSSGLQSDLRFPATGLSQAPRPNTLPPREASTSSGLAAAAEWTAWSPPRTSKTMQAARPPHLRPPLLRPPSLTWLLFLPALLVFRPEVIAIPTWPTWGRPSRKGCRLRSRWLPWFCFFFFLMRKFSATFFF